VLSQVLPVVAAIFGALLLFGGLVSAGAWLVRRLHLPVDLPDGCRFEPRPPVVGSEREALERAKIWRSRRQACVAAERCYREAVQIHQYLAEISDPQRPLGELDRQSLVAELTAAAHQAERDADAATAAMHDPEPSTAISACEAAAATNTQLRETWDQRLGQLPPLPRSYRTLILLGALLAMVMLWLLVVLPLLIQEPLP
jgi:hypothetical protein